MNNISDRIKPGDKDRLVMEAKLVCATSLQVSRLFVWFVAAVTKKFGREASDGLRQFKSLKATLPMAHTHRKAHSVTFFLPPGLPCWATAKCLRMNSLYK